MKSFAFLFVIALAFSSCKKDEEVVTSPVLPSPPEQTDFDDFVFTMDGTVYTPGNVSTSHADGVIVRQGSTANELFRLSISDAMQPGYYPIYQDGPFEFEYSQDNFASVYSSFDGAASIVTHDTVNNRITGYYNCNLVMPQVAGTVKITNAEFDIHY